MILRLVHLVVKSAKFHQFLMISTLHYISVANDQDAVSVSDRGQAMGNYEAGLIFHQSPHSSLDLVLGAGVYVGSCLIQDQHRSLHK